MGDKTPSHIQMTNEETIRRQKEFRIIPIKDLVVDEEICPRVNIDYATVSRYSYAMKSGSVFPPVQVAQRKADSKFVIIDGRHRVEAMKVNGEKDVQVEIIRGLSREELYEYSVKSNIVHGRQFTTQEVTQIILKLKDLDYDLQRISDVIKLPVDKIEGFVAKRIVHISNEDSQGTTETKPVAVKSRFKYLAGKTFTEQDFNANTKSSSDTLLNTQSQIRLVDSLITLIKNDWLNKDSAILKEKMDKLKELLK